jgi:hypothetical protein
MEEGLQASALKEFGKNQGKYRKYSKRPLTIELK